MKELFTAFTSHGYDWSEFHVYRHPLNARKYAVRTQSGCSCNYFVNPTKDELKDSPQLGKREVYAKFSTWWGRGNAGTRVDNMQRLHSSL
jgi:hypothetical protein